MQNMKDAGSNGNDSGNGLSLDLWLGFEVLTVSKG